MGQLTQLRPYAGRLAVVVCALVLAAGGWLVFGGGSPQADAFDDACEGVVAQRETKAVLGAGVQADEDEEAFSEGSLDGSKGTLQVGCDLVGEAPHVGEVSVDIYAVPTPKYERADQAGGRGLYGDLNTSRSVPLGRGWHGVFAEEADGDDAVATHVLLDCRKGRNDLLVKVKVELEESTTDNPDRRTAFARIATATAANASEHWRCDAPLGTRLRTVAQPVNEDEHIALAGADGTCAGVPVRSRDVTRAWESARAGAPAEVCEVGDVLGEQRFRLSARYGPYAEAERYGAEQDDYDYEEPTPFQGAKGKLREGYWGTAKCPGSAGSATFAVLDSTGWDRESAARGDYTKADQTYARAALKAFATRSAKAHGCKAPVTP
ncbi:hypothetical protein [Streptomyces sp. NBC_01304]|uniref:hypothetical protein n=1 Tax=Streptomyces sp. NBC_01304 TaxID=2903818 RepID=UPI002E12D2CD|nr:hypothetical protein OG430_17030 [Streptomyces sp. NBC_01304]